MASLRQVCGQIFLASIWEIGNRLEKATNHGSRFSPLPAGKLFFQWDPNRTQWSI